MKSPWSEVLGVCKQMTPDFNNDLLVNFKKQQMDSVLHYLNMIIPSIVCSQFSEISYVGYSVVPPDEAANLLFDDSKYNGLSIERTSMELVKFSFNFDGSITNMLLWVPYLDPYGVTINGSPYYPLFCITERSMNRIRDHKSKLGQYDGIGTQIAFYPVQVKQRRDDEYGAVGYFSQKMYRTILITIRAHHKVPKDKYPPILIYPLAKFGLQYTMESYGYKNIFSVISDKELPEEPDPGITYLQIPLGFMKVNEDSLSDPQAVNFVLTLHYLYCTFPYESPDHILGAYENMYYQIILGKMITGVAKEKMVNLRNQATYHLDTIYLDPVSKFRYQTEDIQAEDIYDLFKYMYFHIRSYISNYRPNDVFNKRLVLAEGLLYRFMRKLNGRCFSTKKKVTGKVLKQKDVSGLLRISPRVLLAEIASDLTQEDKIFSGSVLAYNDNHLFTIGCNKVRSHKPKSASGRGGKGGGRSVLMREYYAVHPSQLVCENPLDFPASNPTVSGSIGGFAEIDKHGMFVKPTWASEIDDIYD